MDVTDIHIAPLVKGKMPKDTTVVVAMSGGVDSSVVAGLLHYKGYNVVGITLQLWDYTPASNAGADKQFGTCCALDDVYDARRVCQTLGVPHYVLNYESEFKEKVVDDFVETYLAGATPIPCVRCNQRIKFDSFMDKAKALGADVLVTGHYVRKVVDENGHAQMLRGLDHTKDQSYFLFTTNKEQLEYSDFPLGNLTKDETRNLAKRMGLHIHGKKDSQDICFVPGGNYRDVVKKYAPTAVEKGQFVDEKGKVLGEHEGILGYTVGQRKGLPGGAAVPMYVIEIHAGNNQIILGPKESLDCHKFTVKEVDWLADDVELDGLECVVQVRYGHKGVPATLKRLENNRVEVSLHRAEAQISPGQAAVFYVDERLLGGGWIEIPQHLMLPKGMRAKVQIEMS